MEHRLAGNLNVSFERVDGDALLVALPDLAVSTGSACNSHGGGGSHVLEAIGMPRRVDAIGHAFRPGAIHHRGRSRLRGGRVVEVVRRLREGGRCKRRSGRADVGFATHVGALLRWRRPSTRGGNNATPCRCYVCSDRFRAAQSFGIDGCRLRGSSTRWRWMRRAPVTDLTADDFEVVHGGRHAKDCQLHMVRYAAACRGSRPGQAAQLPALDLSVPDDPAQPGCVVDDLGLSPAGINAVRSKLKGFVGGSMGPGDRVVSNT